MNCSVPLALTPIRKVVGVVGSVAAVAVAGVPLLKTADCAAGAEATASFPSADCAHVPDGVRLYPVPPTPEARRPPVEACRRSNVRCESDPVSACARFWFPGNPVGALGVPLARIDGLAQGCVATLILSAFRVTAALVVRIGGVANACALLSVGTRVKLAPVPTLRPPPGVHEVEPATGSPFAAGHTPAVATLVTALIAPAEVVTLSTGFVVQPVPE